MLLPIATRTFQCRVVFLAIPVVVVLPLLVICGSGDTDGAAQGVTNTPETTSSAETQGTDTTAGEVIMEAEPVNDLSKDDVITVDLSDLDPDYSYYATLCTVEKVSGSSVPGCTSDRSTDTQSQQWVTRKSGGTTAITDDDTTCFEFSAVPTGETVDCTRQDCVLRLLGDHSKGFGDITKIPVTLIKQPNRTRTGIVDLG